MEKEENRYSAGKSLLSPTGLGLIVTGLIVISGMGWLITDHVRNRELSNQVKFNSWTGLVSRTIQENDRCIHYANELKREYPTLFGEWNSEYLAYKIEGIEGNPNCGRLIPGEKVQMPAYSKDQ